jgi:cell division septation protein DedD
VKFAALAAAVAALALAVAPAAQGAEGEYGALLSSASTLSPKDALKMADSLSRAPAAPGRVKAMWLRIIGDHNFLKEDYNAAADAYQQASKLDSASTYRHLYALAIAMNGQTEAAREIWTRIALDKADAMSAEAEFMLAQLPKPPAPPPPTPVAQPKAEPPNAPIAPPVNQPATAPAPTATAMANQSTAPSNTPVSTPAKVDDVKKPSPPPAPTAAKADDAKKPPPTPAAPPVNLPSNAPEGTYTIQVGAFASKENADNLVTRLKGKYENITVSPIASGGQTLYRVRVGSFPRKEDAAAFADKLIIEAGLSARVTEK